MSLGISTFHFTRWVALRLAELKSNHRIKIDISDTLGKEQWRKVLSNRSDQDTFCKEKYMGSKMKLGPLEKWKIYKFKILSLTTVFSNHFCYFSNLRLWKKLLIKVQSNEKGIVWGRKKTFTIVHDLEKCYVDSCTELSFPIRPWSTEFNLVKNF